MKGSKAFVMSAWGFVIYLLGVILFGAWVRITGSGAGCGSHWPTCHGEVIPRDPSVETIIEFTHRLTSGMCGIFGLVLLVWAWRRFGAKHRVFLGVVVTMAFIVLESLIGAGIVLKELVASDDSVARAVVIALHLVNTLALTSAASLTAWWASGKPRLRWSGQIGPERWLLLGALIAIIVTSMTGAVTALGDTLFPIEPTLGPGMMEKIGDDLSSTNHFLVRLRIVHPVISMGVALFLLYVGDRMRGMAKGLQMRRWSLAVIVLVCLQVAIGLSNIALSAPGWIQLVHLLVAKVLWIAVVMVMAEHLTAPGHESAAGDESAGP